MWDQNGGDFTSNSMAGGFFSGTPGSQAAPSEKKAGAQRAHNVIPINISDVLTSPDEKLRIEDNEVHMVTFVGTVESIESKQTNISYSIRDDTGTIEVVQWIEGEGNPVASIQVVENTYCRVIGSVRQSQDKRHIMAFRVSPISSVNEITSHLLETQYVRLKMRQLKSKMGVPMNNNSSIPISMGNNTMSGPLASSTSAYNSTGITGLTSFQTMVYNIIQATTTETGIEKSQIYSSVKGKMGNRDVDAALEFLCSEGHIYSTVDEDHFKSTDS
jgi:replication factor A2